MTDMDPPDDKLNGSGGAEAHRGNPAAGTPPEVHELALSCVQFVERALGVRLDYEPETLPVLDHYIEQGRGAVAARPETLSVLAHCIGAYFGEVVRKRHPSWWKIDGDDPTFWEIQFEQVYLSFAPVGLAYDALLRGSANETGWRPPEGETTEATRIELDDEDRQAAAERLAELPEVTPSEYYAPSTRLEVIDILVDVIKARRMAEEEPDAHLRPEDYDRD